MLVRSFWHATAAGGSIFAQRIIARDAALPAEWALPARKEEIAMNVKQLESLLREGTINRREFLARAAALGVAGAVPATLSIPALAQTPKQGGRLRMGVGDTGVGESFNPLTMTTNVAINGNMAMRNPLVEIDHEGNAIPELAESWDTSDAKTWRFALRQGVEFHDGKSMDAQDVIYSMNLHRGEDSTSGIRAMFDQIADMRADGNGIVFELQAANADFPAILSDFRSVIVPAGTAGKDFDKGVGTGAYTLVDFVPGTRTLLKRNPNYWKSGRAHFDEVDFIGINDANARANALRTGEVDVINNPDVKTVHLIEAEQGLAVTEVYGTQHYTIPMRTDTPPFHDNDVRLALKYALNRQELIDKILRGRAKLGNDHPIGPSNKYHAADLPQREYDPDKAKFHLKKAGLDSLSVQVHAAGAAFSGAVDACVLYSEHARGAGIDLEVVRAADDGYWSDVWMQKPFSFAYWYGRPTEDMMFSAGYASDSSYNDSYWQHDRFNQLLVQARAELDDAKRREMYREMQRIVRDEGGVVVPMFAAVLTLHSEKAAHGPVSGAALLDGLRLAERWWFA